MAGSCGEIQIRFFPHDAFLILILALLSSFSLVFAGSQSQSRIAWPIMLG
jgi:hypothetical protein